MAEAGENRASPVDVHVGARIRLRRTSMAMSQERLGDALGITFQQVQKYERGVNRVGASRLFDLSRILNVPISYFYDNMPESLAGVIQQPANGAAAYAFAEQQESFGGEMSGTKDETIELVQAYYRIVDPNVRKRMLDLIKSMGPSAA